MISILVASHSKKIEEGMRDLLLQMTDKVEIALPERENDELGTSAASMIKAIENCKNNEVLIICDIGSSIINAKAGLGLVSKKATIADCPFVEGAIAAVMAASFGKTLDEVKKDAEEAWNVKKL